MKLHEVRVYPSAAALPREQQLAWKIAEVAADSAPIDDAAAAMVANRIIDNASVATAALNRRPPANARAQALAHARAGGATLFGVANERRYSAEWAAWANGTAVRELDFHDTFLAIDMGHPGDNIPPLIAVAQQCNRSGADLLRGILTAYEIQVDLCKGIDLHSHKIDHVTHLGASATAGIGALLGLAPEIIQQAVQHAVHVANATRQSRKGEISSWKASAPAHVGKLAVEAVDRAMRGETSPAPIYEGDDSLIAWLLDGLDALYQVPLPEPGEPRRAILETYTKEYSAEVQAQAFIDLARALRGKVGDLEAIDGVSLHTSNHTHMIIGTGANDPQKMDPAASRETLDHSLMYIFAVALQDGTWHHVDSYAPERAARPDTVRLWHKVRTLEDAEWTRRYHETDPSRRAFGGRAEIRMRDGRTVAEELAVADAHPLGARPFGRDAYVGKFQALTESLITPAESARFLDLAQRLPDLAPDDVGALNVQVDAATLNPSEPNDDGIF